MNVSYTAPGAIEALLTASWQADDLARAMESRSSFDLTATVDGLDTLRERLDELGRCLVLRARLQRANIADILRATDNRSMTYCRCDEPARDEQDHCLICRLLIRDEIACTVCGGSFRPTRADAEHCSDACTKRAYRQRQMVAA